MNNKKLFALFGIKRNPFLSDVPVEGLFKSAKFSDFAWKIENLVMDGGFAAIFGDPGMGKSVILRMLYHRLSEIKEICVANCERPQSNLSDFYQEICGLFTLEGASGNRYRSFKTLKERWKHHIETTLFRAILFIDEAQELPFDVLSEIRLLTSEHFDSRKILTVIMAGDMRLYDYLNYRDLLPLQSRIRTKLTLDPLDREELLKILNHVIESAGNKQLMTPGLMETISEHSSGNPRVMMNTCDELLMKALQLEKSQLDEKLFFEVFQDKLPKRKGPR